jgi:hypothetical protein
MDGHRTQPRLAALAATLALLLAPTLIVDGIQPDPRGNLAATADIHTKDTIGIARHVVSAPLSIEGSTRILDERLLLGNRGGFIQLDFGEVVQVAALLIQAEFDDRYSVETSLDGVSWTPLWNVGPVGGPGLRIRHEVLRPVEVRHLRVRNDETAPGTASYVNAIRVYSEIPDGWPHHEAPSTANSNLDYPWLDLDAINTLKLSLICVGSLLFALCLITRGTGSSHTRDKVLKHLLIGVTIIASLGWWNFLQLTDTEYMRSHRNYWDASNYYLGAKYSSELRYTGLYRCALTADAEGGLRAVHARRPFTRDLETNEFVPTSRVFSEAKLCLDRFSPERWEEFKHDYAFFRGHLEPHSWRAWARDHGYNPSPVWTLTGHAIGSFTTMSDQVFLGLIAIDTILFGIMWYVVWTTFGWLPTCGALIYFSTNLVAGNHFVMGSYLRHDWLFFTVVGVCCLKRDRPLLAGALLAQAAMLRIFPAFLIGGVGLGALLGMLLRKATVPTAAQGRFAVGVIATMLIVGGLSVLASDRTTEWSEFVQNTAKHGRTPQIQNMGLTSLVIHVDQPGLQALERVPLMTLSASYEKPERIVIARVLAVLFLLLLALAVAREKEWVAAILGLMWLPFVKDVSNYYWAFLLLFALLSVRKREVGIAFAPVMVLFGVLGFMHPYTSIAMFTWGSVTAVVYFVFVAALFAAPKLGEMAAWRKSRRLRSQG